MVDFAELISKIFACGANNNHFHLSFIVMKACPCKNCGKIGNISYLMTRLYVYLGMVCEPQDKVGPEYCS